MTKLYIHDCAECVYLGSAFSCDLYVHKQHPHAEVGPDPQFLVRYGDEPGDYGCYNDSNLALRQATTVMSSNLHACLALCAAAVWREKLRNTF